MRNKLLYYLHCPQCKGDLSLYERNKTNKEIISGEIICKKCKSTYPIINEIPRFIENIKNGYDLKKNYANSFGFEWTKYNWLREEDELEFFRITDLKKDDLKNKLILDAGCGGGRFSRFVAGYCREFIGIDYSIAVEKANELCKMHNNVHFIQCDINKNPLREEIFDMIYSHGVLHHTPNTKKSFNNLPPLLKQHGFLYIAVFRKAFILLRLFDSFWRSLINKLPLPMLDKVCGILSYFYYLPFASFLKRFFWFSLQKNHQIRKCCLVDWYGPKYHNEHTVEEVKNWFKEFNFTDVNYINAWPYCPTNKKYTLPKFWDNFRLGLLLGVKGIKEGSNTITHK